MLSTNLRLAAVAATGLLLLLLIPATVTAQESDDDTQVRIEIKKLLRACDEGEECEEGQRKLLVIGKDGQAVEAGDHEYLWIGGGHRRFDFHHPMSGKGGYLGVGLTELTDELRVHFGVPGEAGIMVSKVFEGSPAEQAGVRVGDVITAVDGEPVRSAASLARKIRSRQAGESVGVEIVRDGRLETLSAVIEQQEHRQRLARAYVFDCDEEDENCLVDVSVDGLLDGDHHFAPHDLFACDDCSIVIDCDDGDCSCSVDGEAIECPDLSRLPHVRNR